MRSTIGLLSLALFLSPPAAAKQPKLLDWALELLEEPVSAPEGAPAIVLLDEIDIKVLDSSGKLEARRRTLVRILKADGRDLAYHPIQYGQHSKLAHFSAWTIREDGHVEELDRSRVVDVSLTEDRMYSDARVAVLPLRNVGVGSAIAVTYILDEDRQFLQDRWSFQWRVPVHLSRYRIALPPSWDHRATILNHPDVQPSIDGNVLTWEMRDLPGLEDEVMASPDADSAVGLGITYLARNDRSEAGAFRNWSDVAGWYHDLVQPQVAADDELRRAVADIVAPYESRIDRMRAIGRYAQDLRYVSISLGLSAYRPHAATEVFRNRYADCKDKATLMLAMLGAAEIEAFPVLVDTRTEGRVYPSFPSPLQFNHVIVALPIDEEMPGAPTVEHPALGRLLFFDPTDDLTPFGDLPWSDQGTLALVARPDEDDLTELPSLPASANAAERDWEVSFDARGGAEARLRATYTGQYAAWMRARFRGLDDASRLNALTTSIARRVPGAVADEATFDGLETDLGGVRLDVAFRAAHFGRAAGPLLLLEPLRLLETLIPTLPEEQRDRAILFPFLFSETDRMALALPKGFVISERVQGYREESEAGVISVAFEEDEKGRTLERHLEVRQREILPSAYAQTKKFLDAAGGGPAPVVLERESS